MRFGTTSDVMLDAYLRRLGLESEPVGVDALFRLHRAHVECVPYETFWLHLQEGWGISPSAALTRIALARRGGYCFHLNGALAGLLNNLGYRVTTHVAGVHDHIGPNPDTMGNHVAVIVHDLPTETNPDGRWYVDAGLGDVLYEPLPLTDGLTTHGPHSFRLERVAGGPGDWHLDAGPHSSLRGVSIDLQPVPITAFGERHRYNSTSPLSSFARTVTAQRRHRTGSDVLRGCVLTRTTAMTRSVSTFTTRTEWLDALTDIFDLNLATFPGIASRRLDRLWADVRTKHEDWLDQQTTPTAQNERTIHATH